MPSSPAFHLPSILGVLLLLCSALYAEETKLNVNGDVTGTVVEVQPKGKYVLLTIASVSENGGAAKVDLAGQKLKILCGWDNAAKTNVQSDMDYLLTFADKVGKEVTIGVKTTPNGTRVVAGKPQKP